MNVVLTKNKALCVLLQLLMKVCTWHFLFKGVSGMIKWSQPSKEKLSGSAIFFLVFLPPICNFNIREFIISLFLKNTTLPQYGNFLFLAKSGSDTPLQVKKWT